MDKTSRRNWKWMVLHALLEIYCNMFVLNWQNLYGWEKIAIGTNEELLSKQRVANRLRWRKFGGPEHVPAQCTAVFHRTHCTERHRPICIMDEYADPQLMGQCYSIGPCRTNSPRAQTQGLWGSPCCGPTTAPTHVVRSQGTSWVTTAFDQCAYLRQHVKFLFGKKKLSLKFVSNAPVPWFNSTQTTFFVHWDVNQCDRNLKG